MFDVQSFNFTYKLHSKQNFVKKKKKKKETTNVVWNLAAKELKQIPRASSQCSFFFV